eukprot:jgi/Mesvir1/15631/Mv03236-RA.1
MASGRVAAHDMLELARTPFFEVAPELQGSLLYLDAGAGEAAHFCLGLSFLLGLGARGVCSLEAASDADREGARLMDRDSGQPLASLAIFVTRPLPESLPHIRRVLSVHGASLESCRVFSAVSEAAHAQMHVSFPFVPQEDVTGSYNDDDDDNAGDGDVVGDHRHAGASIYRQLEALLRHHCTTSLKRPTASRQVAVHVQHFPSLLWCGLAPSCFVTTPTLRPPPACSASAAGMSSSSSSSSLRTSASGEAGRGPLGAASLVPGGSIPRVDDGGPEMDDEEAPLPGPLVLIGHTLAGVADQLGVKADVFALGPTARAVARVLSRQSQQPGGDASKRPTAAFVLVDRTLDLITPSCHSDNLLDRILTSIPPCRRHDPTNASSGVSAGAKPGVNAGGSSNAGAAGVPLHPSLRQSCFPEQLLPCCCQLCRRGLCDSGAGARISGQDGGSLGAGQGEGEGMSALARLRCASLCHPEDNLGRSLMDKLLQGERVKESAMFVRKLLLDAVKKEKLTSPATKVKLTSVSASEIVDLAALLAQQLTLLLRYSPLIQVGLMVAHALDARAGERWDLLSRSEKALALSVPEGPSALAAQLVDLAHQAKRDALEAKSHRADALASSSSSSSSLDVNGAKKNAAAGKGKSAPQGNPQGQLMHIGDVLSMAAVVYGMAGSANTRLFTIVGEALLEAIMADPVSQMPQVPFLRQHHLIASTRDSSSPAAQATEGGVHAGEGRGGGEETGDVDQQTTAAQGERSEEDPLMLRQLQLEVKHLIDERFERLRAVARAADRLKDPSLAIGAAGQAQPQSLLRTLMSRVGSKADVADLVHTSSGLRGFLRSGLGRFGLQVKAKPGDHQTIVLFVIGGFTPSEVKQAQAGLESASPDIELLVGGTDLLSPESIYEELFQ